MIGALAAAFLSAQTVNSPAAVDPAVVQAAAQAAVSAIAPQPSTATPSAEAVGGAIGTSSSYMRADARLPRITRASTFTVGSGGLLTGTWTQALSMAPNIVFTPIATGGGRITCELTSAPTPTTFAGRCWQDQTVTLNSTVILSGINVGPSTAPAGTQVQVVAIPPTQ